jgi:copper chaperone CopZ
MEIKMKKVFELEELDCAHCAAKMEDAIRKIDGVISANISFMTQKLTLEAADADFDKVLKAAQKAIKKIEPDCKIVL